MKDNRNAEGYYDPTASTAIYLADRKAYSDMRKARRKRNCRRRKEAAHEHHMEVSRQEKRDD